MDRVVPWLAAVVAVPLMGVGFYLVLVDRPVAAGTAWGFGFLFFVLLLLSKFKRFKGFGFEAEMWDQKMVEAGVLIDQLKSLTMLTTRQIASLSARAGLWDSAFSLAELAGFAESLERELKAMHGTKGEIEETLRTLHDRIEDSYYQEARHEVSRALADGSDRIQADLGSSDINEHLRAVSLGPGVADENAAMAALPLRSIAALTEFVRNSRVIQNRDGVVHSLDEIESDIRHFRTTRLFRRRDWLPTVVH